MATQVCSVRSHLESPASPRLLTALTDDLLEEIFIRIACPADLTRASAACVAFRRLITDRTFLRRYRSRHPPLLLGFLNLDVDKGFDAVAAPHPKAAAASALGNISFDFLAPPSLEDWYISDVRDGRVLFGFMEYVDGGAYWMGLAVCDPSSLSPRFLLLPPVPKDKDRLKCFVAAFVPCAHDDDETLFRVIGVMYYDTKLVVLVFDSASGSWTIGTSASWDVLSLGMSLKFLGSYAYGCFYWKGDKQNKLLKLDIERMELSTVDLPPDHEKHAVVIVEAGKGRLGMFSYDPAVNGKFLNCYNSMQTEDQRTDEWQMKNVIPLPVDDNFRTKFWIYEAPKGYLFIQGDSKGQDSKIYSLEIKTLKYELVTQMSYHFEGRPYFGFPPSISPRRI